MKSLFIRFLLLALLFPMPTMAGTIGGSGGHQILDETSSLAQRPALNFTGDGVLCSDNSGQNRTDCSVNVQSAIPASAYYVADHIYPGELQNTANTAWIVPKLDHSVSFDGVNDYITTPDHADLEPVDITISLWIYAFDDSCTGCVGEGGRPVDKGDNGQYGVQISPGNVAGDNKYKIYFIANAAAVVEQTNGECETFTWCHVVITADDNASSDTIKFYINDVLDRTVSTANFTIPAGTGALNVGSSPALSGYFYGRLDNVRIYSSVLSQTDVDSLWNSGSGITCSSVTTNQVLCYDFEDSTTGTTAADSAGTAQNGTLTGMANPGIAESGWAYCVSSTLGTCLQLDGTNDYVKVLSRDSGNLSGVSAFSYEFWYRPNSIAAGADDYLEDKRNAANTLEVSLLASPSANGGKLQFVMDNIDGAGGVTDFITTSSVLTAGSNAHVVLVYDDALACGSGKVKIYVNGSSQTLTQNSCAGGNYPSMNNQALLFSKNASQATGYITGTLDETLVWNKALSSAEVATRYNSGSGTSASCTETGLIYCYHFNDGSTSAYTNIVNQGFIPTSATPGWGALVGNDSNNCTSTPTPCRTPQGVLNKIAKSYGGSTTVYFASGTFLDQATMDGYLAAGSFYITLYQYHNKIANSFSDVEEKSGTSTGSNTANFPDDNGSLFNDTGASFTSLDAEELLQITGPSNAAGYCSTSGYDYRDWYRVGEYVSGTQLKIVSDWGSLDDPCHGIPQATTYKIYRDEDAGGLHGSNTADYGLFVRNSNNIIVRKLGGHGFKLAAFGSIGAKIKEISSANTSRNYNTTLGLGMNLESSIVELLSGNNSSDNFFGGIRIGIVSGASQIHKNMTNRCIYTGGCFGIHPVYASPTARIQYNMMNSNPFAGLDIEIGSVTFDIRYNRFDHNGAGIICANLAFCNLIAKNTITDTGNTISGDIGFIVSTLGVISYGTGIGGFQPTSVEVKNQTAAVSTRNYGQCIDCERFTFSGNTQLASVFEDLKIDEQKHGWLTYDHDEFQGGNTTDGSIGNLGWTTSSATQPTIAASVADHPGVITHTTATGAINGLCLGGSCTETKLHTSNEFDFTFIVLTTNVTSTTYRIGIMSDGASSTPVSGVYFESLSADSPRNWYGVVRSASTQTRTTTNTSTSSSIYQRLRFSKVGGDINFYINGSKVLCYNSSGTGGCTASSNIPSAAEAVVIQITDAASGGKSMNVDYVDIGVPKLNR